MNKLCFCLCLCVVSLGCVLVNAQPQGTTYHELGIYKMPPFERAVRCIKYYEQLHTEKDYPFIGYGHRIRSGEKYRYPMSIRDADMLLRRDLLELCRCFRSYGKDSLLLATLAYNVGIRKVIGGGEYPESRLIQLIKEGRRDIMTEYIDFCHWEGRAVPSIRRRRINELMLLFEQ